MAQQETKRRKYAMQEIARRGKLWTKKGVSGSYAGNSKSAEGDNKGQIKVRKYISEKGQKGKGFIVYRGQGITGDKKRSFFYRGQGERGDNSTVRWDIIRDIHYYLYFIEMYTISICDKR